MQSNIFHFSGLLSTAIYYNATITTKGETVPLREAVQNFFNSKAWKETKETLSQLYNYYTHHGWRALWEEFLTAFDPQGEAHAYEVFHLFYCQSFNYIYNCVETACGILNCTH